MPHGGKRKGSGRPVGTGKFKLPTKIMRVPECMEDEIVEFIESKGHSHCEEQNIATRQSKNNYLKMDCHATLAMTRV